MQELIFPVFGFRKLTEAALFPPFLLFVTAMLNETTVLVDRHRVAPDPVCVASSNMK
jgi:hypothetical protein